jgi:hypothetical protein|tara:strand:+ start:317 stop:541 length:225 start_codon:yes stop_codon:yes gene_type:complete
MVFQVMEIGLFIPKLRTQDTTQSNSTTKAQVVCQLKKPYEVAAPSKRWEEAQSALLQTGSQISPRRRNCKVFKN